MDEVNQKPGDQYINVSISLQSFDLELLDRFKDMRRCTRSQIVREALQMYYLKIIGSPPPLCGEVVDANDQLVSSGLITDALKARIDSGELRIRMLFK